MKEGTKASSSYDHKRLADTIAPILAGKTTGPVAKASLPGLFKPVQ
jgi:hypothetical protein